jgi:pimeloyl-ACP methyl ester carboxylesterase
VLFKGCCLSTTRLLVLTFALAVVSNLAIAGGGLELKPCRVEGVDRDFRCGTLQVPEDRDAPEGRTIPLNILVAPAGGPGERLPDPLFMFAGGPGLGGTVLADYAVESFSGVNEKRDIVLVDLRGTGKSNPLNCRIYGTEIPGFFGDLFPPDAVKACRAELEKKADLRLYTTARAVEDTDDVRKALGYGKINLYGTSYGTRVALAYMRRFPDAVRAAILDGVAPTDAKVPLYHATAGQRALDLILAACESDAKCHGAFPDVKREIQDVLARFDKGAVDTAVTDPKTGKAVAVKLDRGSFGEALRNAMYSPKTIALLPSVIHKAFLNDYTFFAQINLRMRTVYQDNLAIGMFLSVACAEDIPLITPEDTATVSAGTFLGDYRVAQQVQACRFWPRGPLPEGFNEPVRSDAPTLIVSGDMDPVTPPSFGDHVLATLPHGVHAVLKSGSHSGTDPCLEQLIEEFISAGSAGKLDLSCAAKGKPPEFSE